MDRLIKALEQHGTIHVIGNSFSIAGYGHIDLTEEAPEDRRNDTVLKRYAANILRVVPQQSDFWWRSSRSPVGPWSFRG